jgi:hypothetical protein
MKSRAVLQNGAQGASDKGKERHTSLVVLERAGVVRRLLVQLESLVPGIGQCALGLMQGDSAVAQLSTVMYMSYPRAHAQVEAVKRQSRK